VFTFATLCLSAAAQNIQRKKGQHKAVEEEEPNHNKQTSDDKLSLPSVGGTLFWLILSIFCGDCKNIIHTEKLKSVHDCSSADNRSIFNVFQSISS